MKIILKFLVIIGIFFHQHNFSKIGRSYKSQKFKIVQYQKKSSYNSKKYNRQNVRLYKKNSKIAQQDQIYDNFDNQQRSLSGKGGNFFDDHKDKIIDISSVLLIGFSIFAKSRSYNNKVASMNMDLQKKSIAFVKQQVGEELEDLEQIIRRFDLKCQEFDQQMYGLQGDLKSGVLDIIDQLINFIFNVQKIIQSNSCRFTFDFYNFQQVNQQVTQNLYGQYLTKNQNNMIFGFILKSFYQQQNTILQNKSKVLNLIYTLKQSLIFKFSKKEYQNLQNLGADHILVGPFQSQFSKYLQEQKSYSQFNQIQEVMQLRNKGCKNLSVIIKPQEELFLKFPQSLFYDFKYVLLNCNKEIETIILDVSQFVHDKTSESQKLFQTIDWNIKQIKLIRQGIIQSQKIEDFGMQKNKVYITAKKLFRNKIQKYEPIILLQINQEQLKLLNEQNLRNINGFLTQQKDSKGIRNKFSDKIIHCIQDQNHAKIIETDCNRLYIDKRYFLKNQIINLKNGNIWNRTKLSIFGVYRLTIQPYSLIILDHQTSIQVALFI